MERLEDQGLDWHDEGLLAVSLLGLGCAGVVVPMLAWAFAGLILILLGALVTVALWQRAALHQEEPSRATRLAVWMLEFSALWMLFGRALLRWLSN